MSDVKVGVRQGVYMCTRRFCKWLASLNGKVKHRNGGNGVFPAHITMPRREVARGAAKVPTVPARPLRSAPARRTQPCLHEGPVG